MLTTDESLHSPRAAVAVAREHLEHAAAALTRGQAAYSAANDRIRSLDDEDSRRASAYAERFEQAAIDGAAAVPYFEVAASDAAERHRAQIAVRGASEALERLTAAHSAAQVDVATAERELRVAVDEVLDARSCALMEAAETHLRALEQIGAELAELLPDTRFDTSAGLQSEPAARELLKRLPLLPRSDLDVPVNELRIGGPAVSRLAELRAELLNDLVLPMEAAA